MTTLEQHAPLVETLPLWRREPYRLLFPEGVLLAWAGVLVWFLYGVGVLADYPSGYHALVQIEGFLGCFATGFLFTFIPRRTGAEPARPLEIAIAMAAPVVTAVAAWMGNDGISQLAWLVLVATVLAFATRRLLAPGATLKMPNAIVWVPLGLAFAAGGSILLVWGEATEAPLARIAGSRLLLQGMLTAFVVGIGATLLPVLTRGEAHAETTASVHDAGAKALHALAALLFAASFFLEVAWSPRAGYALRAAVVATVLIGSARIDRLPVVPGLHRSFVWASAWLLPVGFALAAAFPAREQAGLHVVFIGGFTVMALSVAYHVALAHGGRPGLLAKRPWPLAAMGALLGCALLLRIAAELDAAHAKGWLAAASAAFLVGTLCWAALALPRLGHA